VVDLAEVVERGDLDELVRVVDGLGDAREWRRLLELRERCQRAVERGKQLWPAAHLIEYRVALDAPSEHAAAMLVEGAGRFGLGPIPEVAAQRHPWADLAPHAPPGPPAALCAHERVLRGEDLRAAAVEPAVLDVPLARCGWEPDYALAEYRTDRAEFPPPAAPALGDETTLGGPPERVDDAPTCRALIDLADGWTIGSNGTTRAEAVAGDHAAAIRATGVTRARIGEITGAQALAFMAWTAASGGAFGRRRGAATGRFDAWIAAAALTGLDDWPVDPDRLGDALGTRRWFAFDDLEATPTGWSLRLAIEDPGRGRAWAVVATDRTEPTPSTSGGTR
jgi:hypothetical protein